MAECRGLVRRVGIAVYAIEALFFFNISAALADHTPACSPDIDTLHIDSQSHFSMSFDAAGLLGAIPCRDEDILTWSSPGWSLTFDGSAETLAWQSADLDAWSQVVPREIIFLDGFQ